MSGIVLIWQRDGAPVDRDGLAAMLGALQHRVIDGRDRRIGRDATRALATLHFWTTSEEQGECPWLVANDVVAAFDGRLDKPF